jgi:hypothetical protein
VSPRYVRRDYDWIDTSAVASCIAAFQLQGGRSLASMRSGPGGVLSLAYGYGGSIPSFAHG